MERPGVYYFKKLYMYIIENIFIMFIASYWQWLIVIWVGGIIGIFSSFLSIYFCVSKMNMDYFCNKMPTLQRVFWVGFTKVNNIKGLLGIFLSKKKESFPLPHYIKTQFYISFLLFLLFYRNFCFNVILSNLTKLEKGFYLSLYFYG